MLPLRGGHRTLEVLRESTKSISRKYDLVYTHKRIAQQRCYPFFLIFFYFALNFFIFSAYYK